MKALVVDDRESIRNSVSENLRNLGYETTTANNAADGFGRYQREHPELVLMDYQLGLDDGVVLTGRIREYEKAVKRRARIVLMSAELPDIDFQAAGIDAVYEKGRPFEELLAAISPEGQKIKP